MRFIQKYIFLILTALTIILFLTQALVLHTSPFSGVVGSLPPGNDYNSYYHAAKRSLVGDNMYFVDKQTIKFDSELPINFVYPPLMSYVFIPFSLLSLLPSFYLFSLFSIILFLLSVLILSRYAVNRGWYLLLFPIIYFLSPAIILHLDRGQTDILILFLVVLSFLCCKNKKSIFAGVLIGIAAALKLTPLIFLPYFFIRDRKAFWASILTIFFSTLLFKMSVWQDFLTKIKSFSTGASLGNTSNSLLGLIYNKYTFDWYSLDQAKIFFILMTVLIVGMSFWYIYRNRKLSPNILVEYAMLTSLMAIVPPTAWVYNNVYALFLLTAYWNIRATNFLSRRKIMFFDLAAFVIVSQPILSPLIRACPLYHIFASRPLFFIFFIGLFIFYLKKHADE